MNFSHENVIFPWFGNLALWQQLIYIADSVHVNLSLQK